MTTTSAPGAPGVTGVPAPALTGRTLRFSGNLLLAVAAGIALQIWLVALIGGLGAHALYLRSLYAPVGFVSLAITEGLAITVQVCAGIAARNGTARDYAASLLTLTGIGLAAFAALAAGLATLSGPIEDALGVPAGSRQDLGAFLTLMTVSAGVALIPAVCEAGLRGLGRTRASAVLAVGHVVAVAVTVGLLVKVGHTGVYGVPLGYLAATVPFVVATAVTLDRAGIGVLRRSHWHWRASALPWLGRIALPVGASLLLLSTAASGYLALLHGAPATEVSGFGLGQIVQGYLVVPATVLGSGAALAANLSPAADRRQVVTAGLRALLVIAGPVYLLLAAGVFAGGPTIVDGLTGSAAVRSVGADYLTTVAPTLCLLGPSVAVLGYLEQVGRATIALLLNAGLFGATLLAAALLPGPAGSLDLARVIAVANTAGFAVVLLTALIVLRRPEEVTP